VLSFLMVVPTGRHSGFLLAAAGQRTGPGRGECGDSGGDELGAEERFADPATLIYAGEPVWAGIVGRIAGERLPAIAWWVRVDRRGGDCQRVEDQG
jgi:hypothetical protein